MEKGYYQPRVEELYIGYECEINTSYGWQNGTWPLLLKEDTHFNLFPQGDSIRSILNHSRGLRTKYLTKEQVEAEGWKYTGKSVDIWFEKEGEFKISSWTSYKLLLNYGLTDHRLRIVATDIGNDEVLYLGTCPSINELRTLMKLLNIKK